VFSINVTEQQMKLAAARMREKIKNLIDELHHKVALFLVEKSIKFCTLPIQDVFETQSL